MQFNFKKILFLVSIGFISFQSLGQVINHLETDKPPVKRENVTSDGKVVYDIVDENADFPGGMSALRKYLSDNIAYPERALKNKIEGKCYIQFIITDLGKVENIVVKKGVTDCPECDAESVKAIEKMPLWTPGKINGKPVNSFFSLPVSFKL
ncbi:MAG: energy transducer TonB [Fluviicola sp.]